VTDTRRLLTRTAELAADYLEAVDDRPVYPRIATAELYERLGGPLPEGPQDPQTVIEELVRAADPGIVASAGGRYHGFVIGGAVPAATAADWMTSVWDQDAGLWVLGPAVSVVEEVCRGWLAELLGLPAHVSAGFVTGAQMANFTCLATARHAVLEAAGWDVAAEGLFGAPPLRVLVGRHRHVSIDRGLRLLGIGAAQIRVVETDGRMQAGALAAELSAGQGPAIVCAQAGEVNTGSFDPFEAIADLAAEHDAWLHVDGAFGLWAATVPELRHLVHGVERADSWTVDGHKWLNVPYDSAFALCARPEVHRAAMATSASYIVSAGGAERDSGDYVPELSRRARGLPTYAAIRSLGRSGIAAMVARCCAHARRIGSELAALPGVEVLNEVVLNQVLFRASGDERTDAVMRAVQDSGETWMSGTTWDGGRAIRISVSNWITDEDDVGRTLQAIRAAVAETA
jgi:glutamate/tyrosine decarboxylase-like PLP-dependent enzyme